MGEVTGTSPTVAKYFWLKTETTLSDMSHRFTAEEGEAGHARTLMCYRAREYIVQESSSDHLNDQFRTIPRRFSTPDHSTVVSWRFEKTYLRI